MSMRGLQKLTVDLLIQNRGRMTEAAWNQLTAYGEQYGWTAGEKASLFDPEFLKSSQALRQAGINYDQIVYEPSVLTRAQTLARTLGVQSIRLPSANQPPPPPPATDLARAKEALATALGKGKDLGTFENWSVQTTGADVSFAVSFGGKKYPALSLSLPDFKDPQPARNLVQENAAALRAVNTIDGLKAFVTDLIRREKAYLGAEGVQTKSKNEGYGIEQKRRDALFGELARAVATTAIPAGERAKAGMVLVRARESLITNRDFNMEVGSHTNYWPYWNNYASFLVKVLEQTDKGSDEYLTMSNRLRDIYTRKTVFSWNREVVEQDFESSLGAALIYNPKYSRTAGHRVSLGAGSTRFEPNYELLSVNKSGLPANLQQYAGVQVYRDGDALKFDYMGEGTEDRAGKAVPEELKRHITTKALGADDRAGLTIRKLVGAEEARDNFSADWDGNGAINIAKILIGWWGHCHNESPLNAMGVDPQKGIELYRADRKVKAEKAAQSYSEEDAWNVAGAFAADHEYNPEYVNPRTGQAVQIDRTAFVGDRNNGGHWFRIAFNDGGQPRKFDAEVTAMWHRAVPGQNPEPYPDPMSRFRRDVENEDGTFGPNPDWVNSGLRQEDEIIVDAMNRKIELKLKYVTIGGQGFPVEEEENVLLDPSKDGYVKLGEEISDRYPNGGGKITEHRFNPKTKEYLPVVFEVKAGANGQYERAELTRGTKRVASEVQAQQETTFDSVQVIHEFVTARMGLPFTFDTSSGMAVWNYPVNFARVDTLKEVEKVEDGKKYFYTTYKLAYSTMGGPGGESRYIIKRDEAGNHVRSTALDPMPDFAFRNEKWVCAPAAEDERGQGGLNYQAYDAGYLLAEDGQKMVPELWRRQATLLFASLTDKTAKDAAYLFEDAKGNLISFDTKAEFEAAKKADLDVRRLEA